MPNSLQFLDTLCRTAAAKGDVIGILTLTIQGRLEIPCFGNSCERNGGCEGSSRFLCFKGPTSARSRNEFRQFSTGYRVRMYRRALADGLARDRLTLPETGEGEQVEALRKPEAFSSPPFAERAAELPNGSIRRH